MKFPNAAGDQQIPTLCLVVEESQYKKLSLRGSL